MAGTSNYPGALDDFSAQSPTNLGDDDSTGRTHSERHDDLEAAMEAVQGELGVDPAGPSASTVAVRFTSLDSAVAGKVSASIVTASAQVLVGAASSSVAALSSGSAGQVLTVSGSATYGLAWLDPAGGATVEMSDTEPVSPDNGTLWVDTDSDVPTFTASAYVLNSLFANKGTIAAASAASTPAALSVGSNGQMLMADSSATAGLRYVDPPANRNIIINGAMQVAQRGTSVTGITGDGYRTADRWNALISSMGTWTQTVEADGPSGSGFARSLKMLCTTADAAPAAGDLVLMAYRIEGQDLQRVKTGTASAEQLTLSFWVKSNVTGTYIVDLINSDAGNRQVSGSYTISASATWEKKTITFPADTTGGYDNDNTTGLGINIWLGAGTDYTAGTLNTSWASLTQNKRATGQTNLAAATNNYWQITGVQLETGPVATPFEFEPYEATLRKCQRYYYLHASGASKQLSIGAYNNTNVVAGAITFPTSMRTAPTLIASSGTDYYRSGNGGSADDFNSLTIQLAHENGSGFFNNSEAAGGSQYAATNLWTLNASASVAFNAEL